mmetsp:Transcript_124628/g.399087  ORF Transcript_124628/g.399087 Transcript_124628/m.399087 type:complete len:347 (+) Transcript_124628:4548-5588(+)
MPVGENEPAVPQVYSFDGLAPRGRRVPADVVHALALAVQHALGRRLQHAVVHDVLRSQGLRQLHLSGTLLRILLALVLQCGEGPAGGIQLRTRDRLVHDGLGGIVGGLLPQQLVALALDLRERNARAHERLREEPLFRRLPEGVPEGPIPRHFFAADQHDDLLACGQGESLVVNERPFDLRRVEMIQCISRRHVRPPFDSLLCPTQRKLLVVRTDVRLRKVAFLLRAPDDVAHGPTLRNRLARQEPHLLANRKSDQAQASWTRGDLRGLKVVQRKSDRQVALVAPGREKDVAFILGLDLQPLLRGPYKGPGEHAPGRLRVVHTPSDHPLLVFLTGNGVDEHSFTRA